MGEPDALGGFGEPSRWILVFNRTSSSWWVRLLACGRYKHVSAFGWCQASHAWVFYDVRLQHTHVFAANGAAARHAMMYFTRDSDLIGIERRPRPARIRFGFWCVPAIKHLIGLRSGALRPDALYRHCLANGGEIIDEREHSELPASSA